MRLELETEAEIEGKEITTILGLFRDPEERADVVEDIFENIQTDVIDFIGDRKYVKIRIQIETSSERPLRGLLDGSMFKEVE